MSDQALEQHLLQQAKDGDYLAFDALHQLLEPDIMRFVRRLIGNTQEAEDIVQDTFLSLFTHMGRIRPEENIRPYVFRIARNRAYDILRRQGRYEQVSLDDDPVSVRISFDIAEQQGSNLPEDVTHWLLLNLEVREAMENLPELQRQALILYSEEEMSYAEIAEVMDVSVGTIKSRIFHAKKNLRRLLNPDTLAAIQESDVVDVATQKDTPTEPQVEAQTVVPGQTGSTPTYTSEVVGAQRAVPKNEA